MPAEVELKASVPDWGGAVARVERAGGALQFAGALEDRRYDSAERALTAVDHVLRLRVYRDASGARAVLDFKGPTRIEGGYKVREEISTPCGDATATALLLERLGYQVVKEIDREIRQYECVGAIVRFERYPRMDDLVEVEGSPEAIEAAITVLALPREAFTTERLLAFAQRFEARTGTRAATSAREAAGDYSRSRPDA
ncbi:MAG: class IV adenylate cyclase [Gemmatimonadaceae bacterium]|nr:class IV adenylate cyclase [Gemmatimonadaceae bacterium]